MSKEHAVDQPVKKRRGRPSTQAKENAAASEKRPYPTHAQRLAAVDEDIKRLTQLNASREALIAETQALLDKRSKALEKSQQALRKAEAKKARIVEAMNKPQRSAHAPLSPEERAEKRRVALENARAAKKVESEKVNALKAALKKSGISIEDLLEKINAGEEK